METIQRMFSHLKWSNERILGNFQSQDNDEARKLFAHILCAEQVWLARLEERDSSELPIWAEFSLTECQGLSEKNQEGYRQYLNQLTFTDLDRIVSYRNSRGTEFQTSVKDILIHIALHGQYHRGQVNRKLRENDLEPINVDYITFVR
ncbi:DinB family protein [Bacillaceae bacterium S4-13-58]